MTENFQDKFERKWEVQVFRHDPAPYSTKRFYRIKAETTRLSIGAGADLAFFAAFDEVNEAIAKAKAFADLLTYA